MMTIIYDGHTGRQRLDVPEQAADILGICNLYFLLPTDFNLVHIDLRGDIKAVDFYLVSDWKVGIGRWRCGLGGASAWGVYRGLARLFPAINHHFNYPINTQYNGTTA